MRIEHWFYTLPLRLRSLFRSRRVDHELDDEIHYHMEQLAQQNIARGMSPEEARLAALQAMDGLTQTKEHCREARGVSTLSNLARDVRYAVRALRKSPGFAIVAILTLALGIGANSAIFSVVNAVLLRPLPLPDSERLVHLWEVAPDRPGKPVVVNGWNFLDWRENTHTFVDMAAAFERDVNLSMLDTPIAVPAGSVSPGYFSILGIAPMMGRTFSADDGKPGHADKVILSYGFWQQHFGGDRDIIGKKLAVDGSQETIIGIMPDSLSIPKSAAQLWTPLPITRDEGWGSGRFLSVVARLKPNATLAQAQEDIRSAARLTGQLRPDFDTKWSALCVPMLEDVTRDLRLPLLVLLGAVGFLLLIACANVANLVLMRGAGQQREIALRQALGATRRRLIQQLFAEGLVLATAGMAAGVFVSYLALHALVQLIPQTLALPRHEPINIDLRVLAFTGGIALLTGLVFGLVPALRLSRTGLHNALRDAGTQATAARSGKLRSAFVVAELALAILLCMGAGLMLRSFQRLMAVDPGFSSDNVLTMRIFTSPARYGKRSQRAQYLDKLLTEIRNVPGVEAAGTVHFLPLRGMISASCFGPPSADEPNPATSPDAQFLIVSGGYFSAMQTRIAAGRDFDERDSLNSPSVMVVNEAFVRKFLPNQNAIGQRFSVCWTIQNPVEIVGVVADARQAALNDAPAPTIFLANSQATMYFATMVVRARGDVRQITDSTLAAIHRVDPEQAVSGVETLGSVLSSSVSRPRFQMILMVIFAGLALTLAGIGVYGLISYSVAQRTRELGVRLALGAQVPDLLKLVMKEAILLAALGLAAGILCILGLTRVLSSLLYEVRPYDPMTLLSNCLILLIIAALAAYIPAIRATRVDPMLALRSE